MSDPAITERRMTTSLEEALRQVGAAVAAERTCARVRDLVRPGVYVKMQIAVSLEKDGKYKVAFRSATHGTTVNILVLRELALEDGAEVRAEVAQRMERVRAAAEKRKEGTANVQQPTPNSEGKSAGPVTDPRCPDDWKD